MKNGMSKRKIVLSSILGSVLTLQLGAFSVTLETLLSGVTELPFATFVSVMQPIHLAIGLIEGFITSAILCFIYEARPEEKDYSIIGEFAPADVTGKCVYCNHCMPCPMKLDIGLINKYYDLTLAGDNLAKDHYMNLEKTAKDCISCGHCNNRCPFRVDQMKRMKEIKEYFGV